jgi:N-acetylmuramic acid 6-phosphate etherase
MNAEDATVPDAVAAAAPAIAAAIDAIAERMLRGGRLIYAGAGTAGRVGVLDAVECPPTFNTDPGQVVALLAGGDSALRGASEDAEDDTESAPAQLEQLGLGSDDVVVGVSASGRTPYVLAAVAHARSRGALTVGVACNPNSRLSASVDHPIEVVVGPELISGSTRLKAGTAQKLVLNMISTIAMVRLGKTFGNLMVDLQATNEKLRARAVRIIAYAAAADDSAASAALGAAGGDTRLAIVALRLGVDTDEARRRLDEHGGNIRRALESRP